MASPKRPLSAKAAADDLAAYAAQLRQRIEAEVSGFSPDPKARAERRQRAEAQRTRRPGKTNLVVSRGPDPQGGVGGGQRLDRRRRVPGQRSGSCIQSESRR